MKKVCIENVCFNDGTSLDQRLKLFATIEGLGTANIPTNASEILVIVRAVDVWYEHHIMTDILTNTTLWQNVSGYSAVHGEKNNYSTLAIDKEKLAISECIVGGQNYNNSQVSYCYYR